MTQIVLEPAEEEFSRSAAYYESKEAGLGIRFRNEVAAVVDWIRAHSGSFAAQALRLSSCEPSSFSSLRRLCDSRKHRVDYRDSPCLSTP